MKTRRHAWTLKSRLQSGIVGLALAGFALFPVAAQAQTVPNRDDYVARVLTLTNAERVKAGLAPLTLNTSLRSAAQSYAEVMAPTACFGHDCGPVPDLRKRIENVAYTNWTLIGENVGAGYSTPEELVTAWMNSEGHRANILNSTYTEIGIGVATGSGMYKTYWAQEFGARRVVEAPAANVAAFQALPAEVSAPADDLVAGVDTAGE